MGNSQTKAASRRNSSRKAPQNIPKNRSKKLKNAAELPVKLPMKYGRTPMYVFGSKGSGDGELNGPSGLAIIKDCLYVADSANSRVCVYDTKNQYKSALPLSSFALPGSPHSLCATGDGNIAITLAGRRLLVCDTSGNIIQEIGTSSKFVHPKGVATSPDGLLYVCDHGDHRLYVLDKTGKAIRSIGESCSSKMEQPESVAINTITGDVYVACSYMTHHRRVNVYSPEGYYRMSIDTNKIPGSDDFQPHRVSFRQDGMLCVSDLASNSVHILQNGRYVHRLGRKGNNPGQFAHPSASIFSEKGDLIVCDTDNHRIQVFIDSQSNDHAFIK